MAPLKSFVLAFALLALSAYGLSACGVDAPAVQPTATPDAYQIALEQAQSQATKEALDAASLALSVQMTTTAHAPTQAYEATATERAYIAQVWTATTSAQQTQSAFSATSTAASWTPTPNYTATVESAKASAQATALYGESVRVELAIEQDRMMNKLKAVTPWSVLMIAIAIALSITWRWSKIRIIKRDPRGDAPLVYNVVDGIVHDADKQFHPQAGTRSADLSRLALPTPKQQAAVTARAQTIALLTHGAPGAPVNRNAGSEARQPAFYNSAPQLTGPNMESRFQVVDNGDSLPVVDPEILKTLDSDWKNR